MGAKNGVLLLGIFFTLPLLWMKTAHSDATAKKAIFLGTLYNAEKAKAGDIDISDDQITYVILPLPSDWKVKSLFQEKNEMLSNVSKEQNSGTITQSDSDKKRAVIKALPGEITIPTSEQTKTWKYHSQLIFDHELLIDKDTKKAQTIAEKAIQSSKLDYDNHSLELIKSVDVEKTSTPLSFKIFKASDPAKTKQYLIAFSDPISQIQAHIETQTNISDTPAAVLIGIADSATMLESLATTLQTQLEKMKMIDSDKISFSTERDWREFNSYMDCEDLVQRNDFENCTSAHSKYNKNKSEPTVVAAKLSLAIKKAIADLGTPFKQFIKSESVRLHWDNINAAITDQIVQEKISEIKNSHHRFLNEVINKRLIMNSTAEEAATSAEKLKLTVVNKTQDHQEDYKNVELEGDNEKTASAKMKLESQLKTLNAAQVQWQKYFQSFLALGKAVYRDTNQAKQAESAIKSNLMKMRMSQIRQ